MSSPFERWDGIIPLYVPSIINAPLEARLATLLERLNGFQVRTFQTKPLKAKKNRRLVYGIQETSRHLGLGHIKALVVATNIDESVVTSGDFISLIAKAKAAAIPMIYGLSKRKLSMAITKNYRVAISVAGILSTDGAREEFAELSELSKELQKDWMLAYLKCCNPLRQYAFDNIWLAAAFGHLEILQSLSYLCTASRQNPATGDTMLHIAVARGHLDVVAFLQAEATEAFQAMTRMKDLLDHYPIHLAAKFNRKDIYDLLVRYYTPEQLCEKDIHQLSANDYLNTKG